MPAGDSPAPPASPRAARLVARFADAVVLAVFVLFVLKYQYGAAWLRAWEIGLDLLFLGAFLAGAAARLAERRGVAHTGSLILKLALAATMTAISLFAAEHALRYVFRDVRSSGDHRDFIGRRAGRMKVRLNSLRFREREIPPKDPARFRIAVVGDSFTYGEGLEERDRLSNILQGHLGASYEVFNFGRPGNDMPQHLEVLEAALGTGADFVLLQLFVNDFETRDMKRPRPYPLLPGAADTYLRPSSILYDLLGARWNRVQQSLGITESYTEYMRRHLADPRSPQAAESSSKLRSFFKRVSAAGAVAGAVMFPAADALGSGEQSYPFGYLHERVREICREEGVACVDLLHPFAGARDPRTLWVSPFDAHPSAAANRRAAGEAIAAFSQAWSGR